MLRTSQIAVASLVALLAACSLSVEGNDYRPGGGNGGSGSSSAGAGAGSGVSSASASASTSASSANTGSEDCFDNKDTDGDGDVDCKDADCSTVAACGAVPADWTLVRISGADPSAPAGACADGSTTGTLYFMGPAGKPDCSACSCGQPTDAACSAPEIKCYFDTNDCTGTTHFTLKATSEECIEMTSGAYSGVNIPNNGHPEGSCKISTEATLEQNGSCSVSGGVIAPAPRWGSAFLACPAEPAEGGCEGGELCLATSDSSLCVLREGDHGCPPAWPTEMNVFEDGADTRSCTECKCDVGCSGGEYVVRDNAQCQTANPSHPPVTVNAMACVAVPNIFDYDDTSLSPKLAAPMVKGCTGGEGQGQVTPSAPHTICCR